MAKLLADLALLDASRSLLSQTEIRRMLPQEHEFQLIDGVCHLDLEAGLMVAYKIWGDEPWWARGHLPGRPLMPGVLFCEGVAQTAAMLMHKVEELKPGTFVGMGGMDKVRFRGQVTPPGTLYFIATVGESGRTRLRKYPTQADFDGKPVMDMTLLGLPI